MNQHSFKVSILTPSFNTAKYLVRAIDSVLEQDYDNWEHIIIDGGSTDGTVEILKIYSHLLWISEPDLGQSDAMNKALHRSTGDLIIFLNADDELSEGLLKRVVDEFEKHPEVDMVVGNLKISKDGNTSIKRPSIYLENILKLDVLCFPLNPVSYAYKKSLHKKIGLFPIENHYTMDYWFLLRAFLFGVIHKIEFECGTFYFSKENKSADGVRAGAQLREVRDAFLAEYPFNWHVILFQLNKTILIKNKKRIKKVKSLLRKVFKKP